VSIGWYEYVDAKGRPVFPPGSIRYYVLEEGGEAFGDRLWELAVMEGEARTAWNYLESRASQMDYRNLRRRHMVVGSGMAEVGCKLTVGGRLKGPGMHWRFVNGVRVALLRGVIRSRRQFAA
jgi:hypothetical protein